MSLSSINKAAIACIMFILPYAFSACSNESYDTGDGSLSYMRADFVEANTDGNANIISATTDEGTVLTLSPSLQADWATTKDSTYRALLYYNIAKDNSSNADVKPIAISDVLVPRILTDKKAAIIYPTDPVTLETAWLSPNKRYVNLGISLKTGKKDGKIETQSLGICLYDTVMTQDGKKYFKLSLIHDQNNVPEYYSTQVYISIPLYRLSTGVSEGDEVQIKINTYKGETTKVFYIK